LKTVRLTKRSREAAAAAILIIDATSLLRCGWPDLDEIWQPDAE